MKLGIAQRIEELNHKFFHLAVAQFQRVVLYFGQIYAWTVKTGFYKVQ
jgi:hypothetical protein